jgi:hypothetical protein
MHRPCQNRQRPAPRHAAILQQPVYAAAWLVHRGNGWQWAITAEIGVIAFTITAYLRGGCDSDEDALYGSRTDERQRLIAQRSWALAGKITMVAAFAGVTVAVAARAG